MNILYYDSKKIKLPDTFDSDNTLDGVKGGQLADSSDEEDHYVSIGIENMNKKGRMIDIYVSLVNEI